MKRSIALLLAALAALALPAATARAEFGLSDINVIFTDKEGEPDMRAGSHPFASAVSFELNTVVEGEGEGEFPDGAVEDLEVELPVGFAGNPTATPRCSTVDFLVLNENTTECPDSSAVGLVETTAGNGGVKGLLVPFPVYNLEPPPGAVAKLGFWVDQVPLTVIVGLTPNPPYRVVSTASNIPQVLEVYGTRFTLWGTPADPAHDAERGRCLVKGGSCPADAGAKPFIVLPRSCGAPLRSTFRARAWWEGPYLGPEPGRTFAQEVESHTETEPPEPLATVGCGKLGFAPEFSARPSTDRAESPTGLEVSIDVEDEGFDNPSGVAHSDIKKAVVTLPQGITLNPSVAEGLLSCTPAQYEAEALDSAPGQGCPQASKVGEVQVQSPALEGVTLDGEVFVAQQDDPATPAPGAENPFDSLVAIYVVIRDPALGLLVKQAGRVEPDLRTGQLVTTFDEIPQFPLSHVGFRFREGGRSPLISPPACGTYTTTAEFTPWANPGATLEKSSSFQITQGVGGGPCPPAGTPPFAPGFEAGSLDANAGSHTPFFMRLTRRDGDQDMTRFSSILPPGLTGRLAGVAKCPEEAIAAAKGKTGRQELASPSCPAGSEIGRILAGAGVGSQLTYVGGRAYLAGPFGGDPLSVAVVTPAVAGPFDAGTVVVRVALTLNPLTAEVEVDGAASDPIPHILQGIPLRVRDLRVHIDRERFTLNPTSCEPFGVRAQLWGGGADPLNVADDAPVALRAHFQAVNCARLGFRPRLAMRLRGGTRRGAHPAFRAVFRPWPGDANTARTVVRLPRSAFLDQAHIRTVCTRVQFAADACPKGAIYGRVTAFTPLLDEPLRGPAYLRSSDNLLPDLVFDLRGIVDVEASARVDSIKGGIRATFARIPDAPISKVVIRMQGGKKGLIVNSRNLCAARSRATAKLRAHNAKRRNLRPLLRAARCGKRKGR